MLGERKKRETWFGFFFSHFSYPISCPVSLFWKEIEKLSFSLPFVMYFLPSTSFQVIDDNFTSVVAQQKPLQPNNAPQGMVMVNPPPQAAPNQTAIPQLEGNVQGN